MEQGDVPRGTFGDKEPPGIPTAGNPGTILVVHTEQDNDSDSNCAEEDLYNVIVEDLLVRIRCVEEVGFLLVGYFTERRFGHDGVLLFVHV